MICVRSVSKVKIAGSLIEYDPIFSMNNLMFCSHKFANFYPVSINSYKTPVIPNTDPLNYFTEGVPNFEEGIYFQGLNATNKTNPYKSILVMSFFEDFRFGDTIIDTKAYIVGHSQNESTFQKTKIGILTNYSTTRESYKLSSIDNGILVNSNFIQGLSKKWHNKPTTNRQTEIDEITICETIAELVNLIPANTPYIGDLKFDCSQENTKVKGQGIGKSFSLEPELINNTATIPKSILIDNKDNNITEYGVECYVDSNCSDYKVCIQNKCYMPCDYGCSDNTSCNYYPIYPIQSVCQKNCISNTDCDIGFFCSEDGLCSPEFIEIDNINCENLNKSNKIMKIDISLLENLNKVEQCGYDLIEQIIRERITPQIVLNTFDISRWFRFGTNKRHTDILDSNIEEEYEILNLISNISTKPKYYKITDKSSIVSGLIGDTTLYQIQKTIAKLRLSYKYGLLKLKMDVDINAENLDSTNISELANASDIWTYGKYKADFSNIFSRFLKYDLHENNQLASKDYLTGKLKLLLQKNFFAFTLSIPIISIVLDDILKILTYGKTIILDNPIRRKSEFKKIFSYDLDIASNENITAESDIKALNEIQSNNYYNFELATDMRESNYKDFEYYSFCDNDTLKTEYAKEIPLKDPEITITGSKDYECNAYLNEENPNYNILLTETIKYYNNSISKCGKTSISNNLCIPSPQFFRKKINELKLSSFTGEKVCSIKGGYLDTIDYLRGIVIGQGITNIASAETIECLQNNTNNPNCQCGGNYYGFCSDENKSCVKSINMNTFSCVELNDEEDLIGYQTIDNEDGDKEIVTGEYNPICNINDCFASVINTLPPQITIIDEDNGNYSITCVSNGINTQTGKKVYKCLARPDFYIGMCNCYTGDELAIEKAEESCALNTIYSNLTCSDANNCEIDKIAFVNKCSNVNSIPNAIENTTAKYCSTISTTNNQPFITKECLGMDYLELAVKLYFPNYEIIFENNKPCFTNDDCTKYDEDDNVITGTCTSNICNY